MKFNLSHKTEAANAVQRFKELLAKGSLVEIKKVQPRRTLSQNNYLHLILAAFGNHFGYDVPEAKIIYKREANPELYVYDKNGMYFLRSSADLSKEAMAKSIDRFREYSATHGYPLPAATDTEWLRQIENEIERSSYYL